MKVQLLLAILLLIGCTNRSDEINFKKGIKAEISQPDLAIKYYKKVFDQSSDRDLVVESAVKLFNIYYYTKKNYIEALKYLNYIVPNTSRFKDAQEALKLKAHIEYRHLSYYEKAIESYNKLLAYEGVMPKDEREFRWNIVKSYVEINDKTQALAELEELKKLYKNESNTEVKLFEASIYQGDGELKKAIELYSSILKQTDKPEEKKEILLNLALCYEQQKEYSNAVQALEKISGDDEILSAKKKQLKKMATIKKRKLRK